MILSGNSCSNICLFYSNLCFFNWKHLPVSTSFHYLCLLHFPSPSPTSRSTSISQNRYAFWSQSLQLNFFILSTDGEYLLRLRYPFKRYESCFELLLFSHSSCYTTGIHLKAVRELGRRRGEGNEETENMRLVIYDLQNGF